MEVRVEAEAQVLSPIQQEGVAHSDTNYTQVAFSKVDNYPVVLVPKTFALPYYVNQSFLIAPFYSKKESLISSPSFINFSLATGVFVIAFMFFFQSVFPVLYPSSTVLQKIPDTSTASVMTASQEVFASVFSFVTKLPELAVNTFGNIFNKKSNLAVNEDVKNDVNDNTSNSIVENNIDQNNSSDDVEFNGMAVTPSTGSAEKDEALKQKIRASFSDEVAVTPDNSGTAGVITPVFKKSTGDDFLYVLVPVNDIN